MFLWNHVFFLTMSFPGGHIFAQLPPRWQFRKHVSILGPFSGAFSDPFWTGSTSSFGLFKNPFRDLLWVLFLGPFFKLTYLNIPTNWKSPFVLQIPGIGNLEWIRPRFSGGLHYVVPFLSRRMFCFSAFGEERYAAGDREQGDFPLTKQNITQAL